MSVFSDQRVIDFIKQHFVPVTTDINLSQYRKDAEGDYFRKIAEQGHYAGRTKPTRTRQGLYVATAGGDLLASINSTRADAVLKMMKQAVAKWQQRQALGKSDDGDKLSADVKRDKNYYVPFPEGGMILREVCRDLPREDEDFENWKHNFDNVWLTAQEVDALKPTSAVVGQKYKVDDAVIRRLAQFHFVDHVNGECVSWKKDDVKEASLEAEVISVANDVVKIRLDGHARCVTSPSGAHNPYTKTKVDKERGVDLRVVGYLNYQPSSKTFQSFELIATGPRWGTDTYNFRQKDMGPEPIGFAFRMLEKKPENMTQPKFLTWNYFK